MAAKEQKKPKQAFIDFIAGSVGAVTLTYTGQPLDTLKVKMQTYSHRYNNSMSCFVDIFRQEGIRGLYAGSMPAVIANVAENSCLFLAYGQCQNLVKFVTGKKEHELTSVERASAGSMASFFSSLTLCPPEVVKCRMQTAREKLGNSKAITFSSVVKQIWKTEGLLGFYRGLSALLVRELPANFFFFFGYEATRNVLMEEEEKKNAAAWKVITAGGMGGISFWLSSYPSDVIKSRLQVYEGKAPSFLQMTRTMIKQEGIKSFYRGLGPTLLRAFPANAALFFGYDYSQRFLWKLSGDS